MTILATVLATTMTLPQPAAPPVRIAAYLRSGLTVHIAPSQTIGGLGGGGGVQVSFPKFGLARADLNYLSLIGHVGELRLGGGIQRPGTWNPAVLGTVSILFGNRLSFRTPEHPWPSSGPVVSAGISIAPLRFSRQNYTASVLELGIGVKPDFPGLGVTYSVGLLEIGHSF